MTKRFLVFASALLLLLGALLLSEGRQSEVNSVVHQHLVSPSEDPEKTGFNMVGDLTTHLPLLILDTRGQIIPGAAGRTEQELQCDLHIIDNPSGLNSSRDLPTQSTPIAIAVRGNSSRIFPKKQYSIRTVDSSGLTADVPLLGMPAESSWVLNGSYIDHSLIRNYMLYNISGEIMAYAPRVRLCEVLCTDGQGRQEYLGVYCLIEKNKVCENRLFLNPYDPAYIQTPFLLQTNTHIDAQEIFHLKPDNLRVLRTELIYPDPEDITGASLEYIRSTILTFEKMLYDASITGDWSRINDAVDLNTFVDYYIINEFCQNYDAGTRSTYLYRDLGGKISIGPVWDFDGTFNNFFGIDLDIRGLELKTSFYYYYLVDDPKFVELCSQRYPQLRQTLLSDEYLLSYIDACEDYLGSAALRNCDRWYQNRHDFYYDDLQKMRDFVVNRGKAMDLVFVSQSQIIRQEVNLP